jgi:antitoxin component HigA of HigAB toxin-antitoxin module
MLITLAEAYEAKRFPIELPDPVEAIKFRMEQAGLTPKDSVSFIRHNFDHEKQSVTSIDQGLCKR